MGVIIARAVTLHAGGEDSGCVVGITGSWLSDRLTAGRSVTGHTLKHLAAAAAGYGILRMLQKRRPVSPLPSTISIATHENQS